jgi:hypothetical protein
MRSTTSSFSMSIHGEESLSSLVAAGGIIWSVQEATKGLAELWQLRLLPPGPLEVCAIGILIWLHAKWRRSVNVNR